MQILKNASFPLRVSSEDGELIRELIVATLATKNAAE